MDQDEQSVAAVDHVTLVRRNATSFEGFIEEPPKGVAQS